MTMIQHQHTIKPPICISRGNIWDGNYYHKRVLRDLSSDQGTDPKQKSPIKYWIQRYIIVLLLWYQRSNVLKFHFKYSIFSLASSNLYLLSHSMCMLLLSTNRPSSQIHLSRRTHFVTSFLRNKLLLCHVSAGNTPFKMEMYLFLFWMVCCCKWNRCTVG